MSTFKAIADVGAVGQRLVFIWHQQLGAWLSQAPLKVQGWVEDLCEVLKGSCDNKIIKVKKHYYYLLNITPR